MKRTAFALSLALFLGFISSAQASERLTVVELFTSQGCSSCPLADAFLGELSMRDDVLALAYHVDYWDYIGWKDVHAKAAYTQRQRAYARAFNLRYVYTPQMIVNGRHQASGNDQGSILHTIEKERIHASKITLEQDTTSLSLNGPDRMQPCNVMLVRYLKEETTEVRRGENRGRRLTDYNIVTSLKNIGEWSGGEKSFNLPESSDSRYGYGLFLQEKGRLNILTAFKLDRSPS